LERDLWDLADIGVKIPYLKDISDFIETYCADELYTLASEYPDKTSLYIKHVDVLKFSPGLAYAIENKFYKIEPILKQALVDSGVMKFRNDTDELLETVKIRITSVIPALKQSIQDLGKKDIGKLVCVDGYARLVSDAEPKSVYSLFECLRCGHVTKVYQSGGKFIEPTYCEDETCGKKGPFTEVETSDGYVDAQRLKIQELPDSTTGTKTQDIIVECEEDLTNVVKPGDRITVVGILKLKPKYASGSRSTINEKIIYALSIEKKDMGFDEYILTQSDEDEIIQLSKDPDVETKIIQSIAPSIYGNEDIKEALALQLFGGVKKILPDGTIQRGEIHEQLIGDPGGAKTRFLRRVVQISPRGIYASGRQTSAAGLTAAAVKDPLNDGAWTLEGGAAVMASGGILAIDEIGQAREDDKSALHEVMENGSISVAKAGNVTTLRAECAILMAGNPVNGYFDQNDKDYAKQMGIPPALWSRVALSFIMLDTPEDEKDSAIASHILKNHRIGGMVQNRERAKNPEFTESEVQEAIKSIEAPISEELLRKYIAYSRMYIFPVATEEMIEEMKGFYLDVRRMKGAKQDSPVPITPRSIEDLQRLSEAHARMRLSNVITYDDVKAAKRLMIESLKQVGMNEDGYLDAGVSYLGKSKSQVEKTELLLKCIKDFSYEMDVINEMRKAGVNESTTKEYLKRLSQKGRIYQIDNGAWKTV